MGRLYGHALSGVRVLRFDGASAPRVLRFDMACGHEGCGGRPSRRRGASMIKPLQPPWRAEGKHANRAYGAMEMHPFCRLRRRLPRRGRF